MWFFSPKNPYLALNICSPRVDITCEQGFYFLVKYCSFYANSHETTPLLCFKHTMKSQNIVI